MDKESSSRTVEHVDTFPEVKKIYHHREQCTSGCPKVKRHKRQSISIVNVDVAIVKQNSIQEEDGEFEQDS